MHQEQIKSSRNDIATKQQAITKRSIGEVYRKPSASRFSIALTSVIFLRAYFSRGFHSRHAARRVRLLFPRVKNRACSREKLVWRLPSCPAHTPPSSFLYRALPFSHAQFRFYRRNLIGGETTKSRPDIGRTCMLTHLRYLLRKHEYISQEDYRLIKLIADIASLHREYRRNLERSHS